MQTWLEDARQYSNNMSIMLIGNKCDLASRRQVSTEEGQRFADENGLSFLETSAKTSQNVEAAFVKLAVETYEKIKHNEIDYRMEASGVRFQQDPSAADGGAKKGGCCGGS